MNIRQVTRFTTQFNKLNMSSRTITKTVIAKKAHDSHSTHDSHAAHGDDHHDDHHHAHPLWETLPFNKFTIGMIVFGGAITGTGLIVAACAFQNKKHGFSK